jgi:hypothetical protein
VPKNFVVINTGTGHGTVFEIMCIHRAHVVVLIWDSVLLTSIKTEREKYT